MAQNFGCFVLEINRFTKRVFILSAILLTVRLIFISNTFLVDDEAYYAMYARHLSWGYIDHGPVVAFVIWFFTRLFESSFTVRLGSVVMMTSLTYLLYFLSAKYFFVLGVKTILGQTLLTLILYLAKSNAIPLVNPSTPNLVML